MNLRFDNNVGLTIIYDRNGAMTINFLSAAPVGISKNFVICFCRPGNTIHSSSQPSIPTAKRRVLGCPCKTNLKANIVIQNDLKTLVSVKCTFLCVVLKMPRVEDSHFNRQNHHVSCQS